MFFTAESNAYKNKNKVLSCFTFIITGFLIWGCNQNKEYIKLDAPLENIIPKIRLIAPNVRDHTGNKIEITVGESYSGEGEYAISGIESQNFTYKLHNQYVVEGNKYIYVIASYNWGGSGTFYYISAVDKTTLKSVDEIFLGDRIKVNALELTSPWSDAVSLTYMIRSSSVPMAAPPNKKVEMHYKMSQSKLINYIK